MKKVAITIFSLLLAAGISAQEGMTILSLDSCRTLAIRNNKELRMADMKQRAARYERKAAFTKYLPRVSATGAYLHTDKEISLLSDEQKGTLSNLGTAVGSLAPALEGMAGALNGVGAGLVDALHTDTRNMGAAAVMLTQPLYMGGKIVAYNRITRYAEQIAARQHDLALQEVIVEVDEAYWQIVALQSKKRLAESYLELVRKLDSDVQQMIDEGVATKADGLSVKVKVNEAQVALIQVNNGLSLSRMLLCQLCGLEMDTTFTLADEHTEVVPMPDTVASSDVQTAFEHRPELRALSLSTDIYKEKVRLARAEFLPTVALTGGWIGSNPSVFNSFERRFKGMWNVGVMVNIPIVTWGERCYKVKAARIEESIAHYRLEETREKVELQVSQSRQKVEEASERLLTATRSREEADENLRYATLGMQEGVIPVSNVLEAQTAWLSAHSECVTAQIDLRLADLYLHKSLGTLK
ncbi:MAG: TolC family protein [Bacteroidales bacterium]|nr:TolC family protein [Bacteroidales bacterium]